jgi:hypothetical protein
VCTLHWRPGAFPASGRDAPCAGWGERTAMKPLAPSGAGSTGRNDSARLPTPKTSIFGIKFCQQSPKTSKNEGMSVDVAENKGTKSVNFGLSVDAAENKGNGEKQCQMGHATLQVEGQHRGRIGSWRAPATDRSNSWREGLEPAAFHKNCLGDNREFARGEGGDCR